MEQRGFFALSEHLARLSEEGDRLEVLAATVDFEYFRDWLVEGMAMAAKGVVGRLIRCRCLRL